VGRQHAEAWIADGSAEPLAMPDVPPLTSCGIAPLNGAGRAQAEALVTQIKGALEVAETDWTPGDALPFERTLLLGNVALRTDVAPVGFLKLDKWQVVAPLVSYATLAESAGSAEERARTHAVVRDLRCLLYEPACLFVRRSSDTHALLNDYAADVARGDDPMLALLRAVYVHKPIILACPPSWYLGRDYAG
ncbi:MAG: hypothetical protein PHO55_11850, partial [Thiomonas arsenitoxydans]|nr:hypothetical protein [Thiomonas arsenitoxydans]